MLKCIFTIVLFKCNRIFDSTNKTNDMNFSGQQLEVMQELANYIKLNSLVIETKEDMNLAFSKYLQSNATNYYLKSDEFEKKQFINQVKKQAGENPA